MFVPCEGKTGESAHGFKNGVTISTTFSFSLLANTGVCELYYAKIHMKTNKQKSNELR